MTDDDKELLVLLDLLSVKVVSNFTPDMYVLPNITWRIVCKKLKGTKEIKWALLESFVVYKEAREIISLIKKEIEANAKPTDN